MTRDEIGKLVAALPQGLDVDEFLVRLVNWAIDIDREKRSLEQEPVDIRGKH
jgi:hypothetical protein